MRVNKFSSVLGLYVLVPCISTVKIVWEWVVFCGVVAHACVDFNALWVIIVLNDLVIIHFVDYSLQIRPDSAVCALRFICFGLVLRNKYSHVD
jgi:hypothetical protein